MIPPARNAGGKSERRTAMDKDYKEKIRKLLALAQSPNEHEARAALLKAREFMAEHKLTEAELKDAERQKVVDVVVDGVTCSKRRDPWIIPLSGVIAENYCCKGYRNHEFGRQTQTLGFIGFEDDVEIAEAVFRYAIDCIHSRIKEIKEENCMYYSKYIRTLCDSYGTGFVRGVAAMYERQQEENEAGWGLVLVTPKEVLEAAQHLGNEDFKRSLPLEGEMLREGYADGENFNPERRLQDQEEYREKSDLQEYLLHT